MEKIAYYLINLAFVLIASVSIWAHIHFHKQELKVA